MPKKDPCQHMPALDEVKTAKAHECVECVKTGSKWVHLRTCQVCGETHCCDTSQNKHATQHFHQSGHAVISSAEPGETWLWCYEDNLFYPY